MSPSAPIPRLGFSPPSDERADIEVMGAGEWMQRVAREHVGHPTRLDFHQLILVTEGRFAHTVDFALHTLTAPSLLAMRPGQVQHFEAPTPWQGWVLIFRPESLPRSGVGTGSMGPSDELDMGSGASTLALADGPCATLAASLSQMALDASLAHPGPLERALLRAELSSLLLRLRLLQAQQTPAAPDNAKLAQYFERFRQATEQEFSRWHQVQQYANTLGISEKTLSRATQAMQGLSAKAFLSRRIALEAKRLLAHTTWPMARVADQLGFDEATNFVKFFRREAGCTPTDFRQQQRSPNALARPPKRD